MPFDNFPEINQTQPKPDKPREVVTDSADQTFGRDHLENSDQHSNAETHGLLNEDSLLEMLTCESLDLEARKRLEAILEGVQNNNFTATAKKLGISRSNLTRWKNTLLESGGDPTSLNAKELQYETEEDIEAIVTAKTAEYLDEQMPQSAYVQITEHGNVVDLDKMKEMLQEIAEQGKDKRSVQDIKIASQQRLFLALYSRHKNSVFVTKDQIKRDDITPKALFYQPASAEAAGSSLDIVDAEFHMPLWGLGEKVFKSKDVPYPTEDGTEVSSMETRIALLLFHPDYGDGRRDPRDGKLYLKNPDYDPSDPKSKKRIMFNQRLLKQFGGDSLFNRLYKNTNADDMATLRDVLPEYLPNLSAAGEITVDDIRQVTLSWKGNTPEKIAGKEIKKKVVMFNGVRHYVGDRFNNAIAEPIDDETALIFSEEDDHRFLQGSFSLATREDAIIDIVESTGKSIPRVNAGFSKPKSINYQKLIPDQAEGFRSETIKQQREKLATQITQIVEHIVELANNAEALVRSEYDQEEINPDIAAQVKTELLSQAKRVVELASMATDVQVLRQQLETFEVDTRAFVALSKNAGLEQLKKRPLEQTKATELSEADKQTMQKLLEANYLTEYPNETDAEFRAGVAESFTKALQNPDTEFYILRDQDRIVSFNRFDSNIDNVGDTVLYFGSFNASPLYKGVGGNLLEETISEKLNIAEKIFAHCDPKSAISKKYIESGFIATQIGNAFGKSSFEIWQSVESSELLQTKNMSVKELVDIAEEIQSVESDYFVREVDKNDPFHELDEGLPFLLTRYFTHEGKTYAAFEINTTLSQKFMFAAKTKDETVEQK